MDSNTRMALAFGSSHRSATADGDRVAVAGLHDAGAVGVVVDGGGEDQGGGAAVDGGQRAGGVEQLQCFEQRVVAALSGGARVAFAVGAGVRFAEGVEEWSRGIRPASQVSSPAMVR